MRKYPVQPFSIASRPSTTAPSESTNTWFFDISFEIPATSCRLMASANASATSSTGSDFAGFANRLKVLPVYRFSRRQFPHFCALRDQFLQFVRTANEWRKRSEVHWDHCLRFQQTRRDRRFFRAHRVEIPDRKKRQFRLIQLGDKRHVAEYVRIAGEVDSSPVLKFQDIPR